jgi:hypothetical protein
VLVNLIPKSSTTSVNIKSLALFFHRPGIIGTGAYPCGARKAMRRSLAILPDGFGDDGDRDAHVFKFVHGRF